MRLCKLSLRNIRKSVKDYAIYFFTLILGVAVFYVFNAIEDQTVMLDISASTQSIIKMMNRMLEAVSVFVSFILGFLIIYANRFLMRRRNKEFGVYLTLGMSKWKISMILFFETLIIGIISLAAGLLAGVGLSQLMSILVSNMFEADMSAFQFVFSSGACFKTLIYFGVMYLLVMLFNTVNVGRCKLIDLLHANKKSETVKLKNPVLSLIVFVASAAMLGYAYYLVAVVPETLRDAREIFIPITLGAVGTLLLFWSLSGIILRIVSKIKGVYYRGLNSFALRQLSSKVNTTVFSMTVICLMLFVTICVMSSSLTLRNSMIKNLDTLAPVDIELSKALDVPADKLEGTGLNKAQAEDSRVSVRETLNKLNFDIDRYFKDVTELELYATNALTIRDTLGSAYEELSAEFPFLAYGTAEELIRVSDYNSIARLYGFDEITLRDNQYAVAADYESWVEFRNMALEKGTEITLNGKSYEPKFNSCLDAFVHISSNHINTGIFIVPDNAVTADMRERGIMLANYNADSDRERREIEQVILDLENNSMIDNVILDASSKIALADSGVGLGTMVVFIGLYLGIVFLISCAAILALKELSESSDNRERYKMLRKIGADEKMINRALFRQIGIFFMFPLIIAVIHSAFGIIFCNFLLESMGTSAMLGSIVMTAVFLVLIYGGYFLITYFCSKSIIREK